MMNFLLITILSLPLYQIRFTIGGIPFTVLECIIVLLFLRWLREPHQQLYTIIKTHKLLVASCIGFIVAATISIFVSPDTRSALGIYKAYFIEPLMFFCVFVDVVRSRKDFSRVLSALAVLATVISAISILQFLDVVPTAVLWKNQFRYTSIFPYPNAVGLFLAPIIPLLVYQAHTFNSKKIKIAFITIAICSIFAIILAKSEGALVALISASIIGGSIAGKKWRKFSIISMIFCVILILTIPIIPEKLLLKDWSGTVRRLMWHDTIVMLKEHPLWGAGLSGYPLIFEGYHHNPSIEIFQYPHNFILTFWSEMGLAGLLSFVLLISMTLYAVGKHYAESRSMLSLALGISLLVVLIHGLVDVPYFKNDLSILFWILIGLILIHPLIDKSQKSA